MSISSFTRRGRLPRLIRVLQFFDKITGLCLARAHHLICKAFGLLRLIARQLANFLLNLATRFLARPAT
jgi:hypothetical protein